MLAGVKTPYSYNGRLSMTKYPWNKRSIYIFNSFSISMQIITPYSHIAIVAARAWRSIPGIKFRDIFNSFSISDKHIASYVSGRLMSWFKHEITLIRDCTGSMINYQFLLASAPETMNSDFRIQEMCIQYNHISILFTYNAHCLSWLQRLSSI